MAAKLRATWELLFWPTWPAAVNRALLLDEKSLSWLHLKRSSSHIAARLQAMWALLFWSNWPAAVDRTLLIDERSFKFTGRAILAHYLILGSLF